MGKGWFFLMAASALSFAGLTVFAAEQKRRPDAVVGGKEITSTVDLYNAVPGGAKKSEIIGGKVKTFSGEVDLICAEASKICVITFKDKK